jgi:TrkA domain protein
VLASPGPSEILRAADVLIVVGTEAGISAVQNLVQKG